MAQMQCSAANIEICVNIAQSTYALSAKWPKSSVAAAPQQVPCPWTVFKPVVPHCY